VKWGNRGERSGASELKASGGAAETKLRGRRLALLETAKELVEEISTVHCSKREIRLPESGRLERLELLLLPLARVPQRLPHREPADEREEALRTMTS